MRAELASGMIAKTLGFLESRIVKYKGPYAATPTLTVADLAIYGVSHTYMYLIDVDATVEFIRYVTRNATQSTKKASPP
ncbi:hypothetical protein PF005_g28156 [Phytophthora fragariae]|uniref:GST C-terminal domain-containing protein n=1 Tax=Phytophthora fragariae TaxID=53985 RepID=A0A6A3VKE6_9STRA|nr:hypothetical protein PF005_g28156 [Phytophthora fragariae]